MRTRLVKERTCVGILLLAAATLAVTGCDQKGEPVDRTPPTGTYITNPADGSAVNSPLINVRGRAEVGATVDIFVDGAYQSSGVSSPAVPYDGEFGRFTVTGVQLGDEGQKVITATVTDIYGNVATEPVQVTITLDQTPPPLVAEDVLWAVWKDTLGGVWQTSMPQVTFVGRTDVTSSGQRLRWGSAESFPDSSYAYPVDQPESLRFYIPIDVPPLDPNNPEALVRYYVDAYDAARNVTTLPLDVFWVAAGKETTLAYDDGLYGAHTNWISAGVGQMLAVKFKAPTWANYIVGVRFHTMNDGITHPTNPTLPTTQPFLIWAWKVNQDTGLPGAPANQGLSTGEPYSYPEDEWVEFRLTTAVNISSAVQFPNREFFAGMEWLYSYNPRIGLDRDVPIDYKSYLWNLETWELQTTADIMIRAIVSDLPSIGGMARTAVVRPEAVTVLSTR